LLSKLRTRTAEVLAYVRRRARIVHDSPAPRSKGASYAAWLAAHTPGRAGLAVQEAKSSSLRWQPLIDLVILRRPLDDAPYAATLESLARQTYPHHRARDASLETLGAVALQGSGELIAIVESGDELPPHALFTVASRSPPDADLYYTDEDVLEGGYRVRPYFKPGWSPDALLSHDYTGGLTLLRRHLLRAVGPFRAVPGAAGHDLLLRVLPLLRKVHHVPDILFQRRADAPRAGFSEERRQVIREYVNRAWGPDYHVAPDGEPAIFYRPATPARVAVIIPIRDKVELLRACLESFARAPNHASIELVVVDNGSVEPATLAFLEEVAARPSSQVLRYPGRFNWSAVNNFAAARSTADYLLFLNNDIEALHPGWLDAMLAFASRPEVGVTGAQLLYPDGTLQHYGVVMGMTGYAGHLLAACPRSEPTLCGPTDMIRNCTAVTGACMLMRRAVYQELGGFDERFILCGSDVAICLRAMERGYRNVVTPHARLTHLESKTRGREIPKSDFQHSFAVYEPYLKTGDPYYNPQLSLKTSKAELRSEPEDMLAFARQFI